MLNEEVKLSELLKGVILLAALAIPVMGWIKYGWTMGLLGLIVTGAILTAVNPAKCAVCGSVIRKKPVFVKINGQPKRCCPTCAHEIQRRRSREALKDMDI